MYLALNEIISPDALVKFGVLDAWYPLHNHTTLERFRETWLVSVALDEECIKSITFLVARDQYRLLFYSKTDIFFRANYKSVFVFTQPINEIRDYFGEEIAMYFAFLMQYINALKGPAILGVVLYILSIIDNDFKTYARTW